MRTYSSDQFVLLDQLGKGSFGVVYKALDKVTNQTVAIKQIDLESSDEDIDEIQKEITILSTCKFPQIIKYYGCYVNNYKLSIIMEILNGGSCLDLLVSINSFTELQIAVICRELLKALYYLHSNGKIHRDIKAANILIDDNDGDVKIVDFGVATQLSNNLSRRNTFVGTPFWMSPEVILQHDYNYKTDIWSLGITAIELALGKPPLSNIHPLKVLFLIPKNHPPGLPVKNPFTGEVFSKNFHNFIKLCLQKNPAYRPTAKQLLDHPFIKKSGRNRELLQAIGLRRNIDARKAQANITELVSKNDKNTRGSGGITKNSHQASPESLISSTPKRERQEESISTQITFDFDDLRISDNSTLKNKKETILIAELPQGKMQKQATPTSYLPLQSPLSSAVSPPSSSVSSFSPQNSLSSNMGQGLSRNVSPSFLMTSGEVSPKKISSKRNSISSNFNKLSLGGEGNAISASSSSSLVPGATLSITSTHSSPKKSYSRRNSLQPKTRTTAVPETPTRSSKHTNLHNRSNSKSSKTRQFAHSHSRSQGHVPSVPNFQSQFTQQQKEQHTRPLLDQRLPKSASQRHIPQEPVAKLGAPVLPRSAKLSRSKSHMVDLKYRMNEEAFHKTQNTPGSNISNKSGNSITKLISSNSNDSKLSLFDFEVMKEGQERQSSNSSPLRSSKSSRLGNRLFDSPPPRASAEGHFSPQFSQSRASKLSAPASPEFGASRYNNNYKSQTQRQFGQAISSAFENVKTAIEIEEMSYSNDLASKATLNKFEILSGYLINNFNDREEEFEMLLTFFKGFLSNVDSNYAKAVADEEGKPDSNDARVELFEKVVPKSLAKGKQPRKNTRTPDKIEEMLLRSWAEGVLDRWDER